MARELDRRPIPHLVPADEFAHRRQALQQRVDLELAEDRARNAETGRRRAWVFAWILILVCAAQAAAIALMLPLKDVVPYTIMVDRQTGYVEVMRGIETGALKEDEALVHSMLAQYVLERETFDPADFKSRYERVALWSTDAARSDFIALYRPGAAGSVLDEMRAGVIVTATVKQIVLVDRTHAGVRFSLTRHEPGSEPVSSEWSALIGYRFTGAPMRMADRLINPLGFQVTSYRRDAEGAPAVRDPGTVLLESSVVEPTGEDTGITARPGAEPRDAPAAEPPPRAVAPVTKEKKQHARPATRNMNATKTSQGRGREVSGPAE
jgi:type IV secretion system protein VirB8